jgi:hypothetical protein
VQLVGYGWLPKKENCFQVFKSDDLLPFGTIRGGNI